MRKKQKSVRSVKKIRSAFKIDDIDGASKKGENIKLKMYINMPVAQCELKKKNKK
jgi:hypothetical protein